MKETDITKRILAYLNRLSQARFVKQHGSVFGRTGQPDIYGCYHGRLVLIEVKRPGERPTPRQEHELSLWAQAGAIAGWADSVQEVHRMLQPFLRTEDKEIAP